MEIFAPGKELLKRELPESVFWLDPYVPCNSIIVLFGRPTLGKTGIVWNIAQAIQTGQPIWGHPTQQTNVLVLELDMPADLTQMRWKDADPPFEPEFVTAFDPVSLDCTQFLDGYSDERHRMVKSQLMELHEKYKFGLVCIDALREVVRGDLNPSGLPRRVYDAFHMVFPGASILFVHHEKKMQAGFSPDPLQMSSGNMEFMNVAQIGLQFHKVGKETYLSHLKTQASAKFAPLPLSICDDGVHFTSPNEERNRVAMEVIANSEGMSMREIDKSIGKQLGVSDRTARTIRIGLAQKARLEGL